jgi:hypothetical protein
MKKKPIKKKEEKIISAYGKQGERGICVNTKCKLMKEGCKGFMGCPGYKSR